MPNGAVPGLELLERLSPLKDFFPRSFAGSGVPFGTNPAASVILGCLAEIDQAPLHWTRFNQLIHFLHEAGVSRGFFDYYFLKQSPSHPYPIEGIDGYIGPANIDAITSISQLCFGIRRFFIDALLYFGDIRTAFRALRPQTYDQIAHFYSLRRVDDKQFAKRGEPLPVINIPTADRHLLSEIAFSACSKPSGGGPPTLLRLLSEAYAKGGGGEVDLGTLRHYVDPDANSQMILDFMQEEYTDTTIASVDDISRRMSPLLDRYAGARSAALENTRRYLSLVNELDIYVATSMRSPGDFRNMARDCDYVFSRPELRELSVRYFDPTISAANCHEDKGLIECLMVKCAKAVLYFAGDRDSYGKDVEVAMALSLGRPSIILCPDDERGAQRMKFFRDIHPLSRLIEFDTGIAMGAMVTQNREIAARLIGRILKNHMAYQLDHDGNGYFRLKEKLTGSVIRLQTSDRLLRESFWNYYHGLEHSRS